MGKQSSLRASRLPRSARRRLGTAIPRLRFNQPPALRPCRRANRAMNWLPLLGPPLRIGPKPIVQIVQEPKLCSINSRHGRLRKMLKRCPGPNSRSRMSEQKLCNPRLYQSVGRPRSRTPLGHRIRRRKIPSRSCDASGFTIDRRGRPALRASQLLPRSQHMSAGP